MVYTVDLKSTARKGLRVRVPPTLPVMKDIDFPNCPRCGGNWSQIGEVALHHYYMCSQCKMQLDRFPQWVKLTSPDFMGNNLHLSWYVKENFCVLKSDEFIWLPWLPYNITPEKLKLYLTFS